MLLATYRSDELDRRHPLTAHGSGLAARRASRRRSRCPPMTPANVTEMIAAILNADEVSAELASLVGERAEGNPFVLEEMLREAHRPRRDRADGGRLAPRLGRHAADAGDRARGGAAAPGTARRRVDRGAAGRRRARPLVRLRRCSSRWPRPTRLPCSPRSSRRSRSSSSRRRPRRASATSGATRSRRRRSRATRSCRSGSGSTPGPPTRSCAPTGARSAVARHLLGAGRTEEAVDACLRAADEAERAIAFSEAAELLERVLPHVTDRARARVAPRPDGPSPLAERRADGRRAAPRGRRRAARRARRGRSRRRGRGSISAAAAGSSTSPRRRCATSSSPGTCSRSEGPSPELALAYLRIAGIHAFELDYDALPRRRRAGRRDRRAGLGGLRARLGPHPRRPRALRHRRASSRSSTAATRRPSAKGYGLIAGNIALQRDLGPRPHARRRAGRPAREARAHPVDAVDDERRNDREEPRPPRGRQAARGARDRAPVDRAPREPGRQQVHVALAAGGSRGAAGARQGRRGGRRAASAVARGGAPGHRVRHRERASGSRSRSDSSRRRRSSAGGPPAPRS